MAAYIDLTGGHLTRPSQDLSAGFELVMSFRSSSGVFISNATSLSTFVNVSTDLIRVQTPNAGELFFDTSTTAIRNLPNSDLVMSLKCGDFGNGIETVLTLTRGPDQITLTQAADIRDFNFGLIFKRGGSPTTVTGRFYYLEIKDLDGVTLNRNVPPASGTVIPDTIGAIDMGIVGSHTIEGFTGVGAALDDGAPDFYQRPVSGNKTITLTGTYADNPVIPTALQYRILQQSDSSVVTDWTTFDAAPSGNIFTLSFDSDSFIEPRVIELRFANSTQTVYTHDVPYQVGDTILFIGQSLPFEMCEFYAVSPLNGFTQWTGSEFTQPNLGTGAYQLANAIIQSEGVAVRIINAAVGSTPLTNVSGNYWNDATGGLWAGAVNDVISATTGQNELAFVYWQQGDKDAIENVTQADYKAALDTFFARVRQQFSDGGGSPVKIISTILGRDSRDPTRSDDSFTGIRKAEIEKINESPFVYGLSAFYYENADGVHLTSGSYEELGKAVAATYYLLKGDTSLLPLTVSSVVRGSSADEIDVNFSKPISDGPYATSNITVSGDGGEVAVSSFTKKDANTATIALASAVPNNATISFMTGLGAGNAEIAFPTSELAIPNTAITTQAYGLPVFDEAVIIATSITLNIGAPDGAYKTYLIDQSDNVVYNGNTIFSGGSATIAGLAVAAGIALEGYVIDNESPHANGAVITGVTV